MAESEEELKSLSMKVKEKSEKAGLKLNIQIPKTIQSHHFMENRCGNNDSDRLYVGGLRNHCRWWLQTWNKIHLILVKKAMTNLGSIL